MRWAAVAAALTIGIAAGWFARGEEKTATQTRDLVPLGAQVIDSRVLRTQSGPNEVAVAWQRNADRFPSEFGLTIWQRRSVGASWRRMYERRIRQAKGHSKTAYFIHDLRLRTADVTRDGREDLLAIENIGGSAGAYVYRLLTTDGGQARQIAERETSEDNTSVFIQYGELILYDGVGKDPKTIQGIHCCPLYWQRTSKRWNGTTLVTAQISRAKSRPLLTY